MAARHDSRTSTNWSLGAGDNCVDFEYNFNLYYSFIQVYIDFYNTCVDFEYNKKHHNHLATPPTMILKYIDEPIL